MATPALNTAQSVLEIGDLFDSQTGSVKYSAGAKIFEQGESGDCAYMIDRGYVEVSSSRNGKKSVLAILGPGEIFGEISLLDGLPRSATATALQETTMIFISQQQLLDAINGAGPLARLVLIASINRLRTTQSATFPVGEELSRAVAEAARLDPHYDAARLDAANQLRLQSELENAITKRQFKLAYQPIVALADGRTGGFEALIRWPGPGRRSIPPMEFIPLAEETGLIIPLGLYVLESALQALSTIEQRLAPRQRDGAGVFMSINVSPRQLEREEHVEQLANAIEQAAVNPASVKLEITEQALLGDPKMAAIALARLKATGASIAIDDFGTGYSSLNYLHRFPLDTLKIDRSFVAKVVDDPARQRIIAAIIGLAHDLEMDVVAEGIEEIEELHWLQSRGCRYGQGFFMAKPSSFTHALTYLNRKFEW